MNTINSTKMNIFTKSMLGFSVEDTNISEIQISAVDLEFVNSIVTSLDEPVEQVISDLTKVFTFSREKDSEWVLADSSLDYLSDVGELLRTLQDFEMIQYNVSTFPEKDFSRIFEKLEAQAESNRVEELALQAHEDKQIEIHEAIGISEC